MDSKDIVQSFITECEKVKTAHDLFSALFDRDDGHKRNLLQSVAPMTFGDLNQILIEYMLLQSAKLTDPATIGKHTNLTSNFIMERLNWPPEVRDRLAAINARLNSFRDHIIDYRTKRGAHLDLDAHTSNPRTLGAFPLGADDAFLCDLEEFIQIAMTHLDPTQRVSLQIAMSEDVHSLVVALAKSVAFDQCPTCAKEGHAKVLDILGS